MIKLKIVALTGILILTAVSITGCKGIKKETGSSSMVGSVEEEAAEAASKEEPEVGMGNPWVEITEEEAKKTCVRLFRAPEGSTDQVWQKCESLGDPEKGIEPLVQLDFKLDGLDFTARAQYGVDPRGASLLRHAGDADADDLRPDGHTGGTVPDPAPDFRASALAAKPARLQIQANGAVFRGSLPDAGAGSRGAHPDTAPDTERNALTGAGAVLPAVDGA